jgi:tripartite ATP-independent transporter DctP family solute receptor
LIVGEKMKFSAWRAVGVVIATLGLSYSASAMEFRSADVHPDDYPTVRAVRYMGELVEQRTRGKDTIKVYPNRTLGDEKDLIQQVKLGALAMVRVNVAPMNNICPETIIPTMPFLFRSKAHMRKTLDGVIGQEILKACEKQGFVGLAFYDSGARSIYTVKKPVRALRDAKGLKIRVQQSDLWVAVLSAMGANATPLPYGEVYTALKTGAIDGAENNYPSYESSRHFEVAKYYSLTEHSMAPEILLFSKAIWDTLTPVQRQIIREAARESVPYMRKLWDERETKALKTVEASGVKITEVDKVSFALAMKPVYDKFVTDPALRELVGRVQKVR